jgi:hypothetical protein
MRPVMCILIGYNSIVLSILLIPDSTKYLSLLPSIKLLSLITYMF